IGSDGLILTNAHVVRDAKEVTVKLADRREYAAKVLGSDPATDIAVLRVNAKNLPVVRFGDPKQLQVGDPVLAIGAPYGFEQSATAGIVSAKGRSLPGDAVVPFIQTDAAVNPGNSGGPLFDGAGGVGAGELSSRIGLASPGETVKLKVWRDKSARDVDVKLGRVSEKEQQASTDEEEGGDTSRLGLSMRPLTKEEKSQAKLDHGLVIEDVGGAAARAGIEPGDVLLAIN